MSISTTVHTPATVDTPGRIVSRYLAWGLWAVALCGVIVGCMSYTWANDNLRNKNYVSKGGVNAPTSFPTATDTIPPEATPAPPSGSNITKITQIVVKFNESMDTTSLALDGDMAAESDEGIWLARVRIDDNTLAISPKTQWNAGSQRTLTIDAKDITGNRLDTLGLTYTVDAGPDSTPPTATVEPASGSDLTQSNRIIVNFNESMDPTSLELGGDMAAESDNGVWSTGKYKDDTLTISPKTQWNVGSQRALTINATDIAKNPLATLSLSYTVTSRGTPGTLKWRYQTGSSLYFSSPAIGADGTIYVGSEDSYLYALNPNGTEKWRYRTGLRVNSSPAIGADGTIYVGSSDTRLYALNPDNTLKWDFKTEGNVHSSPAIGADGTIYVGSDDGYLYAIHNSARLDSSTPWPKFHHNNQNTGRVSGGK